MRSLFSEYYKPENETLHAAWGSALVCFDTNVLLNLYKYTEDTREAFFASMRYLKDLNRLWIPYQVGLEYHRRRLDVLYKQVEIYRNLEVSLSSKLNEIKTMFNHFKKHPYLKVNDWIPEYEELFAKTQKEIRDLETIHPDYSVNDVILSRVTDLFDGLVGSDYNPKQLEDLYKDGKVRYEKQIPPGYKDEKKEDKKNENNQNNDKKSAADERRKFGDLIVWKQLIDKARERKIDVIFVTDDAKEDWWRLDKSGLARPELMKEFKEQTEHEVYIYKSELFLENATINFDIGIAQNAVDEVKDVKELDEEVNEVEESTAQTVIAKQILDGYLAPTWQEWARIIEGQKFDAGHERADEIFRSSMISRKLAEDYLRLQELAARHSRITQFYDRARNMIPKHLHEKPDNSRDLNPKEGESPN
ncbi:PIN-like domain-containing protein [Chitinophaga ginsengisoli]|uniref:PIN like domain-containing protein n=1 Tax=Chitinophaga ginsengisoli TaxID=363837 RepID=A0A2P8GH20_9BACT|nr:PIN-like domain-containing protein [Chitinophaga ginsengisoli]PSL33269.1 hypothetical protein CLV42_103252 [Chitinophaga ginsengisoli]